MKHVLWTLSSLALIVLAGACSKPQENPDAAFEIDATSPVKNQVVPMNVEDKNPEAAADEALPTADEIAESDPIPPTATTTSPADAPMTATPADAAPAAAGLAGTSWNLDEVFVEFRDGDTVFLKGGDIAQFAPDGLEAEYTLTPNDDGSSALSANVLGQPVSGTWDGTSLTIDGKAATAQ